MADGKIEIDIIIDGKPVQRLIADLDKLSTTSKASSKSVDEVGKSLRNVDGRAVQRTVKEFDHLSTSSQKSSNEVKSFRNVLANVDAKKVEQTKQSFDQVGTSSKTSNTGVRLFSNSLAEISGQPVQRVGKDLDSLQGSFKGSNKEVSSFQRTLADVDGKPVQSVKKDTDSLKGTFYSTAKETKSFQRSLTDINGKSVKSVDKDLNRAGSSARGSGKEVDTFKYTLRSVNGKPVDRVSEAFENVKPKTEQATDSVKSFTAAMLAVKVATKVFDQLAKSMDAAINRFDTFQTFPKVMDAFGYSVAESDKAIQILSDGIDGLPTKLDEVVQTSTKMTTMTGNLNRSTNATLALNNAFLASGSSADAASRGTDQYIQMLAKGEVDLMSWKTLQETMPVGLQRTAEAMGFVGTSAQKDLYDALNNGEKTFRDFESELIKLGTGTGELAELARINSEGMRTSFGNLANAFSKGIANVMTDLNELAKTVTGKSIAQNVDSLKVLINTSFQVIGNVIQWTTPIVSACVKAFEAMMPVVRALSPLIYGLVAGYTALKIINMVNSYLQKETLLTNALNGAKTIWLTLTKSQLRKEALAAAASKAKLLALSAEQMAIAAYNAIIFTFTGSTAAATAATTAFGTAVNLALGPIGWIAFAIGGAVTAYKAFSKWVNRAKEDDDKFRNSIEKTASAVDETTSSIQSNIDSRKDELDYLTATETAYANEAEALGQLTQKAQLNTAEKKKMKDGVEQLNKQYADLNLVYDEESNSLNMTTEQVKEKISAYNSFEKSTQAYQDLIEYQKEEVILGMKLDDVKEKRKELNKSYEEGNVSQGVYKESTEELGESENQLNETLSGVKQAISETSQVMTEASDASAKAVEEGVLDQIISYRSLNDTQQEIVDNLRQNFTDLHESATNAFSKMSTDSEISLGEMIENMQHNQLAVQEWGENQAALLEWAGKNGYESFMPFIENIGVDQAGVLKEMVKGLDENDIESQQKLRELAETYGKGGDASSKALKDRTKLGLEGLPQEVENMIIPPVKGSINNNLKVAFSDLGEAGPEAMVQKMNDQAPVVEQAKKDLANAGTDKAEAEAVKGGEIIGAAIGEGQILGIKNSEKDVNKASGELGTTSLNSTRNILGINSPSRKFMEIGRFVAEGLAKGVTDNQKLAVNALEAMGDQVINQGNKIKGLMTSLSNDLSTAFNGLPDVYYNIGYNAMISLNNGLAAGANIAYRTASSIASNISNTMQNAKRSLDPIGDTAMPYTGETFSNTASGEMSQRSIGNLLTPFSASNLLGGSGNRFSPFANQRVSNNNMDQSYSPTFNINIEHADLSNEQSIEETSQQLATLTERQTRGRL